MKIISANPTISTTAYAAGDAVGGKLQFNCLRQTGLIHSLVVVDDDKEAAEMELFLFNADFTASTDNEAFTVASGDLSKVLTVINISTYRDGGSCSIAVKENLSIPFETGNGIIYGQLVSRGTPTYTNAADLQVRLAALPYEG